VDLKLLKLHRHIALAFSYHCFMFIYEISRRLRNLILVVFKNKSEATEPRDPSG
jgi:hypothetical protein